MNYQSNFNNNKISINKNINNESNTLKLSKSILESINIIYDDDFISLINKISISIKENYKFSKQIINKLKNISNDINNQTLNKNLYLNESKILNMQNKSNILNKIYESLNHYIFLIDTELNKFYEKIQKIFKKLKLIRNKKIKNIINFDNFLKTKSNIINYYSNRNNNKLKKINSQEFTTSDKTIYSNAFPKNKNIDFNIKINNTNKIKYSYLKNTNNINRSSSLKSQKIINNNYINNNIENNNDLSSIGFYKNKSMFNSTKNIKRNIIKDSKIESLNEKQNLIKYEVLKNDIIELCSDILKKDNNNNKYKSDENYNNNILDIKIKNLEKEKENLLKQINDKEKYYQNIILNYKKNNDELLKNITSNINNIPNSQFQDNKLINKNENKLMENLKKEINKKNNEINQLQNKINVLDISLDSSLIKNKELNNFISMLKTDVEKLKISIDTISVKNRNIYNNNNLIIDNNINITLLVKNDNNLKEKKYYLKDYILITYTIYKSLKWYLLKLKYNNKSNNYNNYIWVDALKLKEEMNDFNENDLFKFFYHSHNIKNRKNNFKDKTNKNNFQDIKYKEEISNSKHSYIISNIINNQYFILNNKNVENIKDFDLNKTFSFTKNLDNMNVFQKLMNFNKLEKNLNGENNDFKKLDNLAISNIDQENNDEENSLINEIKNINNNNKNILEKNNIFEENKILNEEAFNKTYNSAEMELEAAKNQLTFIKKELRDLKNKFDVVKFSFINLFGKMNFPKKYKVEIIQIFNLLGVEDNKIKFIFDSK